MFLLANFSTLSMALLHSSFPSLYRKESVWLLSVGQETLDDYSTLQTFQKQDPIEEAGPVFGSPTFST